MDNKQPLEFCVSGVDLHHRPRGRIDRDCPAEPSVFLPRRDFRHSHRKCARRAASEVSVRRPRLAAAHRIHAISRLPTSPLPPLRTPSLIPSQRVLGARVIATACVTSGKLFRPGSIRACEGHAGRGNPGREGQPVWSRGLPVIFVCAPTNPFGWSGSLVYV